MFSNKTTGPCLIVCLSKATTLGAKACAITISNPCSRFLWIAHTLPDNNHVTHREEKQKRNVETKIGHMCIHIQAFHNTDPWRWRRFRYDGMSSHRIDSILLASIRRQLEQDTFGYFILVTVSKWIWTTFDGFWRNNEHKGRYVWYINVTSFRVITSIIALEMPPPRKSA